jgi:hypothetical protein
LRRMFRLRRRLVREVGDVGEAATGEAETAGIPRPGDVGAGPGVCVNIDRMSGCPGPRGGDKSSKWDVRLLENSWAAGNRK